jgi:hypothetical protein
MASNVIAYIGNDSFDLILYQSRILQRLGRKVLIADYNETSALTYSIPKVGGIDTFTEINTYRNVDFTRKVINEIVISEYDDVLIDCGYSEPLFNISILTKIIYVADMFRFTLKKLKHIAYYDDLNIKKELLIREASDIKMTAAQMVSILQKNINKVQILYHDEGDYQNALLCHYNQITRFTGASVRLKEYLLSELKEMVKNITYKQLKSALNKAKRGDKRGVIIYEHYPVLVTFPWARADK